MGSRRSVHLLRVASIAFVVALVLAILVPVAGAAPAPCRVTNNSTMLVYEGTGSNLQTAIDQAQRGAKLRVRGLCVGNFTIDRNLKLIGWPTPAYPTPTLNGNAAGTVLTVNPDSLVQLRDLAITNGAAPTDAPWSGGGIVNHGTLTLRGSSSVTASTRGRGIYNYGTLTLNGSSSVSGNVACLDCGGIVNWGGTVTLNGWSSVSGNSGQGILNESGRLTMNDTSSVRANDSGVYGEGGGIYLGDGALTMNDSSSVTGNTASFGGGIDSWGTVILNDSSSVSGNTARTPSEDGAFAGGIWNGGSLTMNDSSSVSGNIVTNPYRGLGGGIYGGTVTLSGSASVTGNTASSRGGGILGSVNACSGPAVFWTGAISPNTPDDPPTPTLIAC